MNITPLIDVTFLLIIFFMLVNNIIGEELVEMVIPEPQTPRTRAMTRDNRIVVNVVPAEGSLTSRTAAPLLFAGEAQSIKVGIDTFAIDDLDSVVASLQEARAERPDLEVVLRADAALYYEEVQPVMTALTRAGIGTVHLAATLEEEGAD